MLRADVMGGFGSIQTIARHISKRIGGLSCKPRISPHDRFCQFGKCRSLIHRRMASTSLRGIQNPTRSGYPERLLVYHAGTGKTALVGCMKITTIFIFTFSCFVLAPAYYRDQEAPLWVVPSVIIGGAVPMLFVLYTTAPFVTYAHLQLPAHARQSSENLLRYVRSIPKTAELDLTTMSTLGRARVTRVPLRELKETSGTLGVSNIQRSSPAGSQGPRAWWKRRPVTQFYVQDSIERGKPRTIWNEVMETIRNNKLSREARSTP